MQTDKPLSNDIAKYISETVTVDNYQITEQELEEAHKKSISSVTEHEAPQKVESYLRSEKFEKMYHDFSDSIMSFAVNSHKRCSNDIIDILMEAMDLSDTSPYYGDIRDKLWNGFSNKIGRNTDEGYYQSLIERFSRDIYEILIQCMYSEDRYNKFYPEMDNFFSLSVFYNPHPTEENKLDYITKTLKDQQMCNLLLFHKSYTVENINPGDYLKRLNELIDIIKDITGLEKISKSHKKFLTTVVEKDYVNACKIITNALADWMEESDNQNTCSAKVSTLLKGIVDEMQEGGNDIIHADISKPTEFRKAYANYFAKIRSSHTYDNMRKDFACDIEILQDVLIHAFIKAINMEKSFIAREVKSIENVILWIESEEFDAFLSENINLIRAEEFDILDQAEAEIKLKMAFIAEINKIINTINQS